MFNRIQKLNAKCYLYYLIYLSYRINKIKNIKDITFIIKNISFFFKNANSDIIITVLTDCLNKYPLNEERMRIISVLQQNYELTNGSEDYCCFILWISIVYSINNNYAALL